MRSKKKKIAFIAPLTKGGPYHIYKEIVDGLIEMHSDELEIYFYSSKKDWFKSHFLNYDYIFSVVPFLFKPLFCKKYIFNPRGNFELEKKKNKLGNKLLYLSSRNLYFSDNIWLVSYFLADKLNFRKLYNHKIVIFSNFIDFKKYNFLNKKYIDNKYNILTITSFKFFSKGKGIINLGKIISKLGNKTNKEIKWTIIGCDDSENFINLKKEFNKIIFTKNIDIIWKGWIDKENIKLELKKNDFFIYWTYLDNFPSIILEAIVSNMKVLVNNYESFCYFLDKSVICNSEDDMVEKIISNNFVNSNILKFDKDKVLSRLYNFINK